MTWQCRPPPPRTQLGQLVPVHGREYISVTLIRFVSLHSIFILNNGPISWHSRRQLTCIALSTTQSEFIAASDGTKEAI
jgi:hypothetical protein